MHTDTIAAVSTPPGRGGIGIVRLSGPGAVRFATQMVWLALPLAHARARFGRVLDPRENASRDDGALDGTPSSIGIPSSTGIPSSIDDAVVTAFLAPHSYTGEDVVEIAAHGSPVVLEALLAAALRAGARLAEPGEFTQRAFLAGKLDLTQAEAVHDLIAARTLEQARAAAGQMGGALSRRLAPVKEKLLHLIVLLEAGMDFASGELDDVDVVPRGTVGAEIETLCGALEALAGSFRGGALLRSGAALALVGRPNAGKSSLFNRLLGRPRAIVTPVPGTTRDTVEEGWSLGGIPVRLVDTAGLRLGGEAPADEAEQLGIERSREALADADLVLLVHDATLPVSAEEEALAAELAGRSHLRVRNKLDLVPTAAGAAAEAEEGQGQPPAEATRSVAVSALTGAGMETLRVAILHALGSAGGLAEEGALNNRRQQEAVLEAIRCLQAAEQANKAEMPHEILLLDLHDALNAIDTLTGQTTADDILARIFSTFCIGK